mgnify:CR=1 FL=1
MPTVDEIAREADEVVTGSTDETARELAETMRDENVGSVVVVEEGEPVGIVTDRDITVRGGAPDRGLAAVTAHAPTGEPNPPPTSGARTLSLCSGWPMTPDIRRRWRWGFCVVIATSRSSVPGW